MSNEKNDSKTEKSSLLSKKADDLTVGESLKINGTITAIATLVPVVIAGAPILVGVIANKLKARKLVKETNQLIDTTATEKDA